MPLFSYSICFFSLTGGARQYSHSAHMTTPRLDPTSPNTPDQPAAGKGMPDKQPKPQKQLPGRQSDASDGSAENALELPNDRDQAIDMTADKVDPRIRQAAVDLKNGLQDTSNSIETNKTYKKI